MDKIKVLLAEDHIVVREGTRGLIEQEPDMEVIGEANDGEEAIELVNKLQGNIVDIAFLIELTFLNGREKLKNYNITSIIQF